MKVKPRNLNESIAKFIVKYKWVFIAIFVLLCIASGILIPKNIVEYDLSSALPKDADSYVGLSVLRDQFDDKGMLYVMIKGVENDDSATYISQLGEIDGVASVIYNPITDYNAETAAMMFTVQLTDCDATDEAYHAVGRICDYLADKDAYVTGQSAYTYYTRQETVNSIFKIGVVLVIAILLTLFFTSKTYFELIPMLLCFGVSVLLNMGTNFVFGGISYVSNLIALVLQLALSIDYSVILLHRYQEERELTANNKDAVVSALSKALAEILSSSLTTIAGLVALLMMTLPIGVEIGLSLAKSIVCSLVTVIFLMPSLLILFEKPLLKTKHKNFVPCVKKPARQVVRARKVILPLFLVVVILSGVGQFYNRYAYDMNGADVIVKSKEQFAQSFSTLNSFVVVVPSGDPDNERRLASYVSSYEVIDGCNALATIDIADFVGGDHLYLTDEVTSAQLYDVIYGLVKDTSYEQWVSPDVVDYLFAIVVGEDNASTAKVRVIDLLEGLYNDSLSSILGEYKDTLGQLVVAKNNLESNGYSRLTFNINSTTESDETFAFIQSVKAGLGDYCNEFYITGESVVCYDMAQLFPRDNLYVSVFVVVFMLVILFFTFRNLLLPLLLVFAIQGGIWINFVVPFLVGNSVSFIAYLIITAIQMGATIDYAIVVTNRYQTTKHLFENRLDAMADAQDATFPTVITSAVILIVAGFTLGIASSGVVASMGMILGIGVSVSLLTVLFVLPSLLLVFDKLIDKAMVKLPSKRK